MKVILHCVWHAPDVIVIMP